MRKFESIHCNALLYSWCKLFIYILIYINLYIIIYQLYINYILIYIYLYINLYINIHLYTIKLHINLSKFFSVFNICILNILNVEIKKSTYLNYMFIKHLHNIENNSIKTPCCLENS